MPLIGKLVVCGVGLIGGSFALALRRAGAVGRIIGVGRRREPLERAQALLEGHFDRLRLRRGSGRSHRRGGLGGLLGVVVLTAGSEDEKGGEEGDRQ